ncbi:uncharacterized protein LOC133824414 [Humulus lupulus]|uniref:uncharacterized protein LOC133824414 n=1 Tax=Humulus lupulus TaxID=3486 RepID=UPI002B40F702|nr:uncharacterized protein LOC133824414 [Humulus lupulus]
MAIKPTPTILGLNLPSVMSTKNDQLWPQKIQMRIRCFLGEEGERHHHGIALYRESFMGGGRQYGAYGVPTLERPDMSLKSPSKSTEEPILDHGGGSMDDSGGSDGGVSDGSGGGGAGGDDDSYRFDDEENNEDETSGLFRGRHLVPEVFDKETLNAILQEWMKTMRDLPMGLQQACELGALSSAKLTRFFFFNTRPTLLRHLTRLLPPDMAMDFVAKIMADPSLPYKLCLEAVFSLGCSIWLEEKDFKRECWPLVLTNAVTNATCNALFVWSLAPKHVPFGSRRRQRVAISFFHKAVAFFALGFTAKAFTQVITHENISVSNISKEALAVGLSLGLVSNLRYHLISGIDRRVQRHFDVPMVSLAFCLALRFVNIAIGTHSHNWVRPSDQVVRSHPPVHSLVSSVEDGSSVNWFNFKKAISTITPFASKRKRVLGKQKVRSF